MAMHIAVLFGLLGALGLSLFFLGKGNRKLLSFQK